MENIKLTILGTEYDVTFNTCDKDNNLVECNGYCDVTTKKIVIHDISACATDCDMTCEEIVEIMKTSLRHEIIHAMLYESGLHVNSGLVLENGWAMNEEMVDWIAIQAPKLYDCFEKARCI